MLLMKIGSDKKIIRWTKQCFFLSIILMASLSLSAQNDRKKVNKSQSESSVSKSASRVSDALEQNASDEAVAGEYVTLAKELTEKNDYSRAEDYLKRALNLYLKMNKNDLSSSVYRELAKVQEFQNRSDEAIVNYRNAARFTLVDVQKQLNENDAKRLEIPADLVQQSA